LLTPILEHTHKAAVRKVLSDLVLRHERKGNTLKCSLKYELCIIHNSGPFTATESSFLPFSNSPRYSSEDTCRKLMHLWFSKSQGFFGLVRLEVVRRSHDGWLVVPCKLDCNHVFLVNSPK
jgi:hypothetical protein